MVVREGSANREINFEATRWRVEEEFGSIEWIIFVQLEQSMIESSLVRTFQIVKAKMKLKNAFTIDKSIRYRLFIDLGLLFLQSQKGKFLNA